MEGLNCMFPLPTLGTLDTVKIGKVEEVGPRDGIPYLRFRAQHNPDQVLELLGSWTVLRDEKR